MPYTKPQQRKKEESERLKGERYQFKLIYRRFERWQVDSGKQEEGKTLHKLHVLGMNDELWDKVRGLGRALSYCTEGPGLESR